jgi:hypothetical protein
VTDPRWLAATSLSGIALGLEMLALRSLPLLVVSPIVAAGIGVLPPASRMLLGERQPRTWPLLFGPVVVGVALLSWTGPDEADLPPMSSEGMLLLIGVVVAAGGLARWRRCSGLHCALLAGCAFGVSTIFARLAASAHLDLPGALAAAGLVVSGLCGLLFEMLAMKTASPARVGPVVLVLLVLIPVAVEVASTNVRLEHPGSVAAAIVMILLGGAGIAAGR